MKTVSVFSIVAIAMMTAPALAAQRTFVSTRGSDANACSLTAPCRSFGTAISHTDPGGEVIVLDSGGYGKFTASQSVSIVSAPGVYAGISAFPGEDGVTITGLPPSGAVVLRGLTINGQGGNRGIYYTGLGQVHVEQCTVSNMVGDGIFVSAVGGRLHLRNVAVRNNGASGLFLASGDVHISDSSFSRNGNGIFVIGGNVSVARASIDDNSGDGVVAQPPSPIPAIVTLADSMLSGNGANGVHARIVAPGTSIRVYVSRSTSTRNTSGGYNADGTEADGTIFFALSDSASAGNTVGVAAGGTGNDFIVTNSAVAGNLGPDLSQANPARLFSSGNNALSGRPGDVFGTLTANPLK